MSFDRRRFLAGATGGASAALLGACTTPAPLAVPGPPLTLLIGRPGLALVARGGAPHVVVAGGDMFG